MNYLKQSILLFESLEDGEEYDFNDIPESNIVKGILDELGFGLKLVFIFGTGIGAFINPVRELLENGGVSMSTEEVALLVITAFAVFLRESPKDISKLKNILTQKGLMGYLNTVTNFIKSSKKLISVVADRMGKVAYNITDILGFTFLLVPTMDVVREVINTSHVTPENIGSVVAGLAGAISIYGIKGGIQRWLNKKNDKPFDEKLEEGYYIRTFSEGVDDMELVWHRDREDRIVESVGDTDWMIQVDNELPKTLTETIYIPKYTYHRVIKGNNNLTVKIKKL
jgi:hypothetical protein